MSNTPSPASGGTVQLHRVFTSTPEKIWRAFTQPNIPG